jgi:hypothetical protein
MNALSKLFLRARPLPLFLFMLAVMIAEAWPFNARSPGIGNAFRLSFVQGLVVTLDAAFIFVWARSVGTFLNSLLEPSLQFEKPFFYFSLVYPILFLVVEPAFLSVDSSASHWLRILLGGLSFICSINIVSSVAKSLVSVKTGTSSRFSDYAWEFFQIWFFPIGVWFIQPKINRLYEARSGSSTPGNPLRHDPLQLTG